MTVTTIPAPRVPFLDERTGGISREWFRFLLQLFTLTGAGESDLTVQDLAVAPGSTDTTALAVEVEGARAAPTAAMDYGAVKALVDEVQLAYLPQQDATQTITLPQALYLYVKASADITKGRLVYMTGTAEAPEVLTAAHAAAEILDPTVLLGLAVADIASGTYGYVCTRGVVTGLDTHTYTEGVELWYSASETTGAPTIYMPTPGRQRTRIGFVVHSHATNGVILVNFVHGTAIEVMSDAYINSPNEGEPLVYNSSGKWANGSALPSGNFVTTDLRTFTFVKGILTSIV